MELNQTARAVMDAMSEGITIIDTQGRIVFGNAAYRAFLERELGPELGSIEGKLLRELPPVDIVITMGCNVSCPSLPCRYREDWGLDDPTGKDDACFLEVIRSIEKKVLSLKNRADNGLL